MRLRQLYGELYRLVILQCGAEQGVRHLRSGATSSWTHGYETRKINPSHSFSSLCSAACAANGVITGKKTNPDG